MIYYVLPPPYLIYVLYEIIFFFYLGYIEFDVYKKENFYYCYVIIDTTIIGGNEEKLIKEKHST